MLNSKMNGKKGNAVEIGGVRTTARRYGRLGEDGVSSASPCGACKLLKRKCTTTCIYAPYFSSEEGYANFAAVNKVYGAAHLAKLLSAIPHNRRQVAASSICSEAQARLQDPVYGCVPKVLEMEQKLQLQADELRKELQTVRAQVINARQKQQQQRMGLFQQADLSAFAGNSNSAGGGMNMSLPSNSFSMDLAFAGNSNSAGGGMNMILNSNSLSMDHAFAGNNNSTGGGMNISLPSNSFSMDPAFAGNNNSAGNGMNMSLPSNSLSMDPAFVGINNSASGGICMNTSLPSNSFSMDPYGYSEFKDETLPDPLALFEMHYENDLLEDLERMISSFNDQSDSSVELQGSTAFYDSIPPSPR